MSSLVTYNFPAKDPDATMAYGVDFSDWLDTGETIDSYTITPNGVTLYSDSLVNGDTQINIILKDGIAGELATVHFHVVTSTGLEDDRTVNVEILEQ